MTCFFDTSFVKDPGTSKEFIKSAQEPPDEANFVPFTPPTLRALPPNPRMTFKLKLFLPNFRVDDFLGVKLAIRLFLRYVYNERERTTRGLKKGEKNLKCVEQKSKNKYEVSDGGNCILHAGWQESVCKGVGRSESFRA